ncbi:hypothetical protein NBRC116596_31430 [Litorivita sp. NS0012-18]
MARPLSSGTQASAFEKKNEVFQVKYTNQSIPHGMLIVRPSGRAGKYAFGSEEGDGFLPASVLRD